MRSLYLWWTVSLVAVSLAFVSCFAAGSPQATNTTDQTSTQSSTQNSSQSQETQATGSSAPQLAQTNVISLPDGLQYYESTMGSGPAPKTGDIVSIHYTGLLEDGTVFDSSYTRGQPYEFTFGKGWVIRGWDEGIAMMQVGSRGRLVVPASLGYGETGVENMIPPNATLYFDLELISVRPGALEAPPLLAVTETVTTESGLQYIDIQVTDGAVPQPGQLVEIHYTGWLSDTRKFDSSLDRGRTLQFRLGDKEVIAGMEEGVSTMKVGSERRLIIPPALAYGETGYAQAVPPNETLTFDVSLISVK